MIDKYKYLILGFFLFLIISGILIYIFVFKKKKYEKKYKCDGNNCIEDINGIYDSDNCNNECNKIKKYKCDRTAIPYKCEESENGDLLDCDSCKEPSPIDAKYKCVQSPTPGCVRDDEKGTMSLDECNKSCNTNKYRCNKTSEKFECVVDNKAGNIYSYECSSCILPESCTVKSVNEPKKLLDNDTCICQDGFSGDKCDNVTFGAGNNLYWTIMSDSNGNLVIN